MGLPFGFVVSVVFLIGRWSSDGEIVAYRSLGGNVLNLLWVVLLFSVFISLISSYSSLEWSPINRSKFDIQKREILWTQTNSLIEERGELEFAFLAKERSSTPDKLSTLAGLRITKATLSVFETSGNNWRNLRIVLSGGPNDEVLVVVHAKKAYVEKNKDRGELILDLRKVDLEYGFTKRGGRDGEAQFVSFDRWKEPIVFQINQENQIKGIKRKGFSELVSSIEQSPDSHTRNQAISLLCKKLSFGTSPFFIGMVLVPIGILRGKSEPFLNLALGLAIGFSFYAFGLFMSGMLKNFALGFAGWWGPNIVCMFTGMTLMVKVYKN